MLGKHGTVQLSGVSAEKVPNAKLDKKLQAYCSSSAFLAAQPYILPSRLCPALPVTRAARFQARSSPCATAGCSPGSHGHYFSVAGSQTQSSPSPAPPICNTKKKSHRACLSENGNVHGALTILFPFCPGIGLDAPICLDSIQSLGGLCEGFRTKATKVTAQLNQSQHF